jgi:hypothetical protein
LRAAVGPVADGEREYVKRVFTNFRNCGYLRGYSLKTFCEHISLDVKISYQTVRNILSDKKRDDVIFITYLFRLANAAVVGTDYTVNDFVCGSIDIDEDYRRLIIGFYRSGGKGGRVMSDDDRLDLCVKIMEDLGGSSLGSFTG